MSRTQVALRFQRAFPRFATSVGGGVGALGFEVPSTVSSDRFLTRLAFVRCRPDVAPCVRVHPELQPVCLSSRGRVVGPEPPVVITRSIRRAARSKAHLAAARPGATERLLQGFPKTAPPSTWPTGVHSRRQDRVASGLLPSAGRCHRPACSVLVVSHHLDGFLHRRLVGLLHPTADPGVHRVSAPRPPCKRASGLPRRCHTLQSLPHPYSRTRVTASRCPLVVSRLRSQCHWVLCDFKALLRTSSALRWSAVAGRPRPVALLGFPSWSITTVVPSWRPAAEADGGCARGPSRGTVRDVHAYPAAGPSDVRCAGEGRPREAVGTVEGGCARGEGPPASHPPANRGHRRARDPR